jgi:SAM-dependent methyltransferase
MMDASLTLTHDDDEKYEQQYVHDTYSTIATQFSATRYKIWPCVGAFINSIDPDKTILEVGCGNGKNMIRHNMFGIDTCEQFIDICKKKNLNVTFGNALSIPFDDESFDNVMAIAMLHHLSTQQRRLDAIKEMIRATKIDGLIFVLVWKSTDESTDKLIPFANKDRYYHLFTKDELECLFKHFNDQLEFIEFVEEKENIGFVVQKKH